MLTREDAVRLLGDEPSASVPRVEWAPFFEWLCATWQAGEHVSIIAPNGAGKTHLIRYGLLPCWQRYPVLILQFKPRDPALSGLGRELRHFPTRLDRLPYETRGFDSSKWESDPEWFRVRLPAYRFTTRGEPESYRRARRLGGETVDRAYWEGKWVLVIDEVRAVADHKQPALGLEPVLENAWQRGRTQPLTIIGATQQPANVPSSFYDQPWGVFIGRMLDAGRHERLAEIGGNTAEIKSTIPTLAQFEFLFIHRPTGEMVIVQAPPAPRRRK